MPQERTKGKQGFASMDEEKQRAIAAKGGKAKAKKRAENQKS